MTKQVEKPISELKDAKARKALAQLCAAYREIATEYSDLGKAKDALMADIKVHANRARVSKVRGAEGGLITKCAGRPQLKVELLVEYGVDTEIIEKSTVAGKPYYLVTGKW